MRSSSVGFGSGVMVGYDKAAFQIKSFFLQVSLGRFMESQHKLFESPVWASRLLSGIAFLSFALLIAMLLPAWRQCLAPLLGLSFGLFWVLFGLFTFLYDWTLPNRGGGYISPYESRWIWLLICFGTVIIGCCCLAFSYRQLIAVLQH